MQLFIYARFFAIVHPRPDPHPTEYFNTLSVISVLSRVAGLCSPLNLSARQIAVEDASRKRPMDLRLLHGGVAYGHSWFG
ncbi:PHD finger protein MALE MEIOCYTE DEATH 1-like, partial [Trifolium medium]|nr:PHD finger protein MALE MEIOCYTE DEATH 1-like [Trifolium medium]